MYINRSPESGPEFGPEFGRETRPEMVAEVEKFFSLEISFVFLFFCQEVILQGLECSKTPFQLFFVVFCISSKLIPHNINPPR